MAAALSTFSRMMAGSTPASFSANDMFWNTVMCGYSAYD